MYIFRDIILSGQINGRLSIASNVILNYIHGIMKITRRFVSLLFCESTLLRICQQLGNSKFLATIFRGVL